MKPPGLEPRRFSDFERELLDRARTWIPSWGLADGERDFGRALLEVAARFNSEVAERLDQVGDKMARGFLDWLAVGGEAARPARMPVAFQLADTARAAVDAPHPVRMQVDALGTNVSFETETDIRLVPGRLQLVVGADPDKDELFLPPPGLSELGPLELLPTRWQLKSFAGPGSSLLQLDPGAGLKEGMLVEIDGQQYAIAAVKDDLATIDPAVPAGNGFESETVVTKVETFDPFERARNVQSHVLYLGHADLLNIEAQATIDVIGLPPLEPGASWEYWGKDAAAPPADAEPRWRTLTTLPPDPKKPAALLLQKPKGAIEPRKVGTAQSRWLRARMASLVGTVEPISVDDITLRINYVPSSAPAVPAVIADQTPLDQSVLPPVDAIVNTMPQTPRDFYPLGREPRMFDTLYVGCAEAFSKKGATAVAHFDLAEPSFTAMSAINAGLIGIVVAGVDKAGALHLLAIGPDLALVRLRGREPLRPGDGASVARLSSRDLRPVMWMVGNDLHVAVVAGSDVWVWIENQADFNSSKWESLGAPASTSNPPSPVLGLVAVSDGGTISLVALRDGKLFMRTAVSGSAWAPFDGGLAASDIVESIAKIGHEDPTKPVSDYLLAVVHTTAPDDVLYAIKSDGTDTPLLQTGITPDVGPCAIERLTGVLEAAAVSNASPRTLVATQTGTAGSITGDLEADRTLADTALDAQIRDGQFVAYGIAKSAPLPGPSQLVTWMPFDPGNALPASKSIVFWATNDPAIGSAAGSVAVLTPTYFLPNLKLAYMPGNQPGEVLMAEFGALQSRRSAVKGDFSSVLAVRRPAPALVAGDTIVPLIATVATGRPEPARVAAPAGGVDGIGDFSNLRFLWLDDKFTRPTGNSSFPEYATSAIAVYQGTVTNTTTLTLDGTDNTTTDDMWLLVAESVPGTIARTAVRVDHVATGVATLDATTPLPAASVGVAVSYWLPRSTISGNIFPALHLTGVNNTWGIDALSRGDIYFPALDPVHQHVIAVGPEAAQPNNAEWLAFDTAWNAAIPAAGNIDFIVDGAITRWLRVLGDSSSNPTLSWEYWNGTGWWHLDIKDETHHLKNSGAVSFKVPTDLQPVDWAGKTNHWIRARLIGGDYGREKVKVITTTTATGTEQVVERSTEGIQPPYALNIWVSYSIAEPAYPTFLLTLDSGTLRDQSDANRTPQAMIEVFTPLISTLQRLASPSVAKPDAAAECVPACACPSGSASTVPASNPAAPTATTAAQAPTSRAASRALFLGFDKKLSGEPVNVLLVVGTERPNDSFAPLRVDALVGDHFVPVVAQDNTRAISETGIVSMSFSVAPTPAEMFGRTLYWLRLAPAGTGAAGGWTPTLRGAYLNAVWARAAETMTRELVGSSEGAPLLTLQLARPPLLRNSLELRVKEPLGAEERDALVADDPDKVRSNVMDLPGDWVLWTQVADPADHEAGARVYSLDEDTGVIRFGDGQHGAIPPIGPDSIVAFRYERTEPAVDGEVPANFVNVRSPLNLVTPVEGAEAVIAADQSAGGVAPESVERVLHFGSARLRHRGRAVTARDFEDLACERFADIVQARCTLRGGNVRLVVVMRGTDPAPSRAQRRELSSLLLAAAPAALAGKLVIEGPKVRRLRIELTLRVASLDVAGKLASSAKQMLQAFFDTDTGGSDQAGWPLGASPTEDDIAEALLNAPHLESIVTVSLLEIDAIGVAQQWPRTIGGNDLVMLDTDGIRISFEIAEVAA